MSSFLLSIDANTSITGATPPTLEVLIGGVVMSSIEMVSGTSSYDILVDYTGSVPSSVALRFAGASGSGSDSINITSASVNNTALNVVTDLTATILMQAQISALTASNETFGHITPTLGITTVTGTGGDDLGSEIDSTNNADTIDALAGNDWVFGRGGDDEINGGAGNDYIFGEGGADTILGGAGDDTLFGNEGDDIIFGEADNDFILGGGGHDLLNGGAGNDGILGGAGDDIIFGETGDDWLLGDAGDDLLFGDDGNDQLIGGIGNDSLAGGIGTDQLLGGAGDDLLSGGAGDDEIIGEGDNDTASGGSGDDDIYGGDGNDILAGGDDNDYISGGSGSDTLFGDAGTDTLLGGAGIDTLHGGDGNDILHAHSLDATTISNILYSNPNVTYSEETGSFYQFVISGNNATTAAANAASTTLIGVNGHLAVVTTQAEIDFLDPIANPTNDASSGSYWLSGGDTATEGVWLWDDGPEAGVQWSNGGTLINNFTAPWAAGQPNGGATQNYTYLWSASDALADAGLNGFAHSEGYIVEWEAGLFSDDNAADTLNGNDGNDWLYGYGGNDILNGGNDQDNLFGGNGDDTLNGGAGNDVLSGGTGIDTASFSTSGAGVTVNLNTGVATGDGTDALISIENVIGSDNADDITGNDGDNILDGGDGADTIRGGNQTGIEVNATTLLSYGGGQDAGGVINYFDDNVGVELDGNLWKKFLVNYTVTADTVIEFDFRSTREAEISGIGFDNDNGISSNLTFKVYGDQNWGRTNFDNYDGSGDWIHYEINVGAFYTGTFSHLFLVNDDDGGGNDGDGYWKNIVIHEGSDESNTLIGSGDGDDLYADNGIDTFKFDTIATVDNIHFFNESEDVLDISDLLTGFVSGTSDINDFIRFSDSGDHVIVEIDALGTGSNPNYVDLAEIRGGADLGLDVDTLFANNQIIA